MASVEAGGPMLYESTSFATTKAGLDAILPELDDVSGDVSVAGTNEVQSVTLTDATGGTFTLTFGGEETSNIAYDAAAASVQANLEALSTIGSGNVSVSGSAGGPWTVTFQGDLGEQNVAEMTIDDSSIVTGSGAVATVTPGAASSWTQIAPVEDELVMDFARAIDEIRELHAGAKSEGVETDRALARIAFKVADAAIAMKNRFLAGTVTTTAAGASQVGKDVLTFGSGLTALTYRHLLLIWPKTAEGYWEVAIIKKVSASGSTTLTWNGKKFQIPAAYDVYRHTGTGFTLSDDIIEFHRKTADATA